MAETRQTQGSQGGLGPLPLCAVLRPATLSGRLALWTHSSTPKLLPWGLTRVSQRLLSSSRVATARGSPAYSPSGLGIRVQPRPRGAEVSPGPTVGGRQDLRSHEGSAPPGELQIALFFPTSLLKSPDLVGNGGQAPVPVPACLPHQMPPRGVPPQPTVLSAVSLKPS